MATPFFGKRETELPTSGVRPASPSSYNGTSPSPGAGAGASGAPHSSAQPVASQHSLCKPPGSEAATFAPGDKDGGSKLTVGPNIKGSAEIDIAEIRGQFDGNLTVRQKLVIYSTGKVTGTIRYGKLVVEEGGQISGEIVFGTQAQGISKPAGLVRPGLQAAA